MSNPEGAYWDIKLTYWVCISADIDEQEAIGAAIEILGRDFSEYEPDIDVVLEEQ